ncbi:MAG: hypothetical protein ACLP59_29675 [Bryobacteraceae bacterium]
MSDDVRITKQGLQAVAWDGEIQQYVPREVETFLPLLRSTVSIDRDVTLLDVFHAVERDAPLKAVLSQYSTCDIDAFHIEAGQPCHPSDDEPNLEYIEIAMRFLFDEHSAHADVDVSGIGPVHAAGHRRYGISLTPVNHLAALPVRLNPTAEIYKDNAIIGTAPYWFTLLEVLGEIYYEISFHGSPKSRDAFGADLEEAAADVESGCAGLVPWETDQTIQ